MENDDSLNLEIDPSTRMLEVDREMVYSRLADITSNADHVLLLIKIKESMPPSMFPHIKNSIEEFANRVARLDGRPVHWFMYPESSTEITVVDLKHQTVRVDGEEVEQN